MEISFIKVGSLRCNCYLIKKNNDYLLIDPGEDYDLIKNFISGKNVVGILVTHNHFDHNTSCDIISKELNVDVYDYRILKEGKYSILGFDFEAIATFGHTMDSYSFYFRDDKVMFTGDFLFKGTIGRCDLEGSNISEMKKSIDKIKKYDDDIEIYPGHGVFTKLGYEKVNNLFFKEDGVAF